MTQEEINDLMWKSMADWQKDQLIDGGNIDAAKRRIRELESENKQLQRAPSNSDYEKCSHVIGLICGVLDITISECDELNLHEIYHKIVEIKNVVKELSQHFA